MTEVTVKGCKWRGLNETKIFYDPDGRIVEVVYPGGETDRHTEVDISFGMAGVMCVVHALLRGRYDGRSFVAEYDGHATVTVTHNR